MVERARRVQVFCRLSEAEAAELKAVRRLLGLGISELLLLGVRRAASQYAAEMRRQRRQDGPQPS